MRATIPAMLGWQSRVLTLFVVAAWIVLGPIGMAFDCCGAMMILCDGGPCGIVTAIIDGAPLVAPPVALSVATSGPTQHPPSVVLLTLDPPPKLVRLSA